MNIWNTAELWVQQGSRSQENESLVHDLAMCLNLAHDPIKETLA